MFMYLLKMLMHVVMVFLASSLSPELWKTPMASASFMVEIEVFAMSFLDLFGEELGCIFAEEVGDLGEDSPEMER